MLVGRLFAKLPVDFFQSLPAFLMKNQLGVEKIGQYVLGNVIFGGAKAAGDQHYVSGFGGSHQAAHDALAGVGNGEMFNDFKAFVVQGVGHEGSVGVGNLANENFIADGKDVCSQE